MGDKHFIHFEQLKLERVKEEQKREEVRRKEEERKRQEEEQREIEEERSKKREAIAENDKLRFKIRSLEDDLQKQIIECDKKAQVVIKLKTEKQNMNSLINEKELAIEATQKLLAQAKDEIRDKENELQGHLRKKADFELIEKNRLEQLESDLEHLQKEYRIQEVERANEREKHSDQFHRLEYSYKATTEENRKLKNKIAELEKDNSTLNQQYNKKCDEYIFMEREAKKHQDHNRQLLIDNEDLKKQYDDARLTAKLEKDKNAKNTKAHEMAAQNWGQEKAYMEKQMVKLMKTLESYKAEGTKEQLVEYKKKTNEYKRKVRQANESIVKLGKKLAILGAEQYDEHEYDPQLVQ